MAESFVFPTYDPESMAGDIAILRLADPVDPSVATPINILPPALNSKVAPGTSLRVLGWGLQAEEGNQKKQVRQAGEHRAPRPSLVSPPVPD